MPLSLHQFPLTFLSIRPKHVKRQISFRWHILPQLLARQVVSHWSCTKILLILAEWLKWASICLLSSAIVRLALESQGFVSAISSNGQNTLDDTFPILLFFLEKWNSLFWFTLADKITLISAVPAFLMNCYWHNFWQSSAHEMILLSTHLEIWPFLSGKRKGKFIGNVLPHDSPLPLGWREREIYQYVSVLLFVCNFKSLSWCTFISGNNNVMGPLYWRTETVWS